MYARTPSSAQSDRLVGRPQWAHSTPCQAGIEQMASAENRATSELMCEGFRQHRFNQQGTLLRRWGEETTPRSGILCNEEVELLVGRRRPICRWSITPASTSRCLIDQPPLL
jgi:hypothetical protein